MNFARALIRDLVDKRLWPIAIVLVAALVAVPLLLSGGGDSTADDPSLVARAPADADADAAKVAAVELAGPPSVRSRPGDVRNPFRRPPVAQTTTETPAAAPADAAPADAPAASGVTGTTTGTTTTPSNGNGSTTQTPTNRIDTTKTIDVRFGKPGSLRRIASLKSGTDLPSGTAGVVRYAGVVAKTRRARFVAVNETVGKTDGDATCYRKDGACYALDMQAGDKQSFVIAGVSYEIEILAVPLAGAGDADSQDVPVSASYQRTEVRFGERLGTSHSISRLTPVPGSADPALIYLGVSAKGATFLLGSGTNATASGEGECVDSRCRIIALKQGESMVVDATQGEGKARRISVAVTSIDEVDASADYAKKMHARVHPDGREALTAMLRDRTAATAIGAIRYDAETGLLVPAASKAGSKADKVSG
jgi:hypothetical protein